MLYWKMLKRKIRLHFGCCLLLIGNVCFAREVVDATQFKTNLIEMPSRIVTLVPSLGELVADFLANDLTGLVAVSEYTDYPPGLKKKPTVGPYSQVNLEKILGFNPDLVLATVDGNPKDSIIHLRELGVPVVTVSTQNFPEIEASMELVALALGKPDLGLKMVQQFKTELEKIRKKGNSRTFQGRKMRVMLQIGDDPLIVAGKKSFLHETLEVVGASNVYGELDAHYPRPSLEDVVSRDPDVIVVVAMGENEEAYMKVAQKWKSFRGLSAVRNRRVKILKSDALLRPTLRILEGLVELDKAIYGPSEIVLRSGNHSAPDHPFGVRLPKTFSGGR